MTKTNTQRIHRIFGILLSIGIIISGILLMISCYGIYKSGEEPYSREAVAMAFSKISLPIYISLAILALSFIVDFFSPFSQGKKKNTISYDLILNRLIAKKDLSNKETNVALLRDAEIIANINKERTNRKRNTIIRFVLLTILSAIFLVYAVNVNNYHQTLMNESMIKAMWIFIPCLVIAFSYTLYTVYYAERSIKREIELLKLLPDAIKIESNIASDIQTEVKDVDNTVSLKSKCRLDKTTCIRISILVIAIFLLIFGYISGGSNGVLGKAIAICTECIGLG